MPELCIALLQLLPGDSLEETRAKGAAACREAKARGADIALFPEMWSCGYRLSWDGAENARRAIGKDSPFVQSFSALARELDMAVGITYLEAWDGLPRNTLTLFDRFGREALTYAKVHTCDFEVERMLTRGERLPVVPLDTARGEVQVGAMICFDREFPETARILMLQGAEVIRAPNACPMEINRLSALRARAYENMLAVATCNYPSPHPDCNGHSTVFDGVAWLESEPGVRDMCILEAPEGEGVYLARVDLEMLRAYRKGEVMGGAYRRPAMYGALVDPAVFPTFVREDRREG